MKSLPNIIVENVLPVLDKELSRLGKFRIEFRGDRILVVDEERLSSCAIPMEIILNRDIIDEFFRKYRYKLETEVCYELKDEIRCVKRVCTNDCILVIYRDVIISLDVLFDTALRKFVKSISFDTIVHLLDYEDVGIRFVLYCKCPKIRRIRVKRRKVNNKH